MVTEVAVTEGAAAVAMVAEGVAVEAVAASEGDTIEEAVPSVGSNDFGSSGMESFAPLEEDTEEMASEEVVPEAGPADPLIARFGEVDGWYQNIIDFVQ